MMNVVDVLKKIQNIISDVEEVKPDEMDLKMISEADKENGHL